MANRATKYPVTGSGEDARKKCSQCKEEKLLSEYSKYKDSKPALRTECRSCNKKRSLDTFNKDAPRHRARNMEWHLKNRGLKLEVMRANMLRRNYDISIDDYNSMLSAQDGKCANKGCPNIPDPLSRMLAVDHDHVTGNVRGLLCCNCNLVLGNSGESAECFYGLIDYLNMNDGESHGGLVAEVYVNA